MNNTLDYAEMGRQIRNYRKAVQWNQAQLAEQVGISLSFLGHIERGTRKASIETLVRIARALNTTVDAILHIKHSNRILPEPEDYFMTIREALIRLEAEHYASRLR